MTKDIAPAGETIPATLPAPAPDKSPLALLLSDPAKLKEIPIETVTRLAELDRQYRQDEAKRQFATAMNAVARDMPAVPKTAYNSQTNAHYAPEDAVDRALSAIIVKHGFTISSWPDQSEKDEHTLIKMVVRHVGGHEEQVEFDAPIDYRGLKGTPNKTKIQGVGASLSYATRHLKLRFFNCPTEPLDNDGAKPKPTEKITDQQAAELRALGGEVGVDWLKFLKYFKVATIEELPSARYSAACQAMEKKRKFSNAD